MINSKKLSLITIVIVAVILVLTFTAMLFSEYLKNDDDVITGTLQYSDVHSIYLDSNDYYTDYTKTACTEIMLYGNDAAYNSRNVEKDVNFLKIVAGGTYVLKGTWNGTIVVDSQDGVAVHLVLAGADINSEDYCGIYVKQAKKVTISTAEGTVNNISDGENYTGQYDEENITAAIYSRDDLTFNGMGTLNVIANFEDGIKSNDGLLITEGTLNINSADDGINANNYTAVLGGNITVNATADGIKANDNDTDEDKGFVGIEGGNITINAGDDGIHAESNLYLNGGNVNIEKSNEGLEGAYIEINGGNYSVVSGDDGINASGIATDTDTGRGMMNEKSHTEVVLLINDGTIKLSAGGDGLDSNGATVINGGYVEVFGPENNGNSSLDFYSTLTINGGTVVAAGSSGMAESPDEGSSQNILVAYLSQTYDAGTTITAVSEDGTELINVTPDKKYSWICVSSPDIETGKTYYVCVDGNTVAELSVESSITTSRTAESSVRGGFGGGKMRDFENVEKPDFSQMGERPQRMQNVENIQQQENEDNTVTNQETPVNYMIVFVSLGILLAAFIIICLIKRRN